MMPVAPTSGPLSALCWKIRLRVAAGSTVAILNVFGGYAIVRLLLIAILVPGLLSAASSGATAHSAPSGWRYDGTCCSAVTPDEHTGDCAPIPASAVEEVPGGYVVTLRPGDHPLVTVEHRFEVPFNRPMTEGGREPAIRPSGDERWHACLYPTEDTLRCLYIQWGGV